MGEIFGFMGVTVILGLFGALLLRVLRIADRLPDMRMKLAVAGVFGWLAAHVVLNVASMIGLVPLTGITLPLLSFGGTSMVFVAGALGLVYQLSQFTSHSTITVSYTHLDVYKRQYSYSGMACSGRAALIKDGRFPFL